MNNNLDTEFTRFILCSIGVFIIFIGYTLQQEYIYTYTYKRLSYPPLGFFLFWNSSIQLLGGAILIQLKNENFPLLSWYTDRKKVSAAVLYTLGSAINDINVYLSGSVLSILARSTYLINKVVCDHFLPHRFTTRISKQNVFDSVLISCSLGLFMYDELQIQSNNQHRYIVLGAFLGHISNSAVFLESRIQKELRIFENICSSSLSFYYNSFLTMFSIVYMYGNDEFSIIYDMFTDENLSTSRILVEHMLPGFLLTIGNPMKMVTIDWFGILVLNYLNVLRKLISLMLSVLIFQHQVTLFQWIMVALLFFPLVTEIFQLDMFEDKQARIQEEKNFESILKCK